MPVEKKVKISRRAFLKRTGIGAGLAVGSGVAITPFVRAYWDELNPVVEENRVELPANGKSVVIMGGGLAGLQTGVELSSRGFKVTVLEKCGIPGGKLKSWRDKSFGPPDAPEKRDPAFKGFVREHGAHGVWGFYSNLREFMRRYGWGLQEMPEDWSLYLFMDKNGTKADWKISRLPGTYGAVQQLIHIMDLGDYISAEDYPAFVRFILKAIAFDFSDKNQRDYLDGISFREWAIRLGLPEKLTDTVLNAIAEMAYFDDVDHVSALSLAGSIQLVCGSPRDLRVDLFSNPPSETFLEPMVEYIEAHGGIVHYNTELTGIKAMGGRVLSVFASQLGNGRQQETRCSVCGAVLGAKGRELDQCPVCGANGDMIKILAHKDLQEKHFEADYFISCMYFPASRRFSRSRW